MGPPFTVMFPVTSRSLDVFICGTMKRQLDVVKLTDEKCQNRVRWTERVEAFHTRVGPELCAEPLDMSRRSERQGKPPTKPEANNSAEATEGAPWVRVDRL